MPIYGLLQVLAVALTAALVAYSAGNANFWFSVVFSLAFCHYLLALWYGRRHIVALAVQPAALLVLAEVLTLAYALYQGGFPLAAYFAVHHAFNEVYLRHARLPNELVAPMRLQLFSSITLHICVVLILIRLPHLEFLFPVLWVLLIGSVGVWLSSLNRYWSRLDNSQRVDQVMLELIVLGLLPISWYYQLTLVQIICYHVIFWTLYPLLRMVGQRQVGPTIGYLVLTGIVVAGFLAISPIGVYELKVRPDLFYSQFILWSWIHITLAFATSTAHPRWITRWFAASNRSSARTV